MEELKRRLKNVSLIEVFVILTGVVLYVLACIVLYDPTYSAVVIGLVCLGGLVSMSDKVADLIVELLGKSGVAQPETTYYAKQLPDPAEEEDDEDDGPTETYEEEEEGLVSPHYLDLGGLKVHANNFFSNRIAVLGYPGSGKSNTVAVLAEELGSFPAPLVIFDLKHEHDGLLDGHLTYPFGADIENVNSANAFMFGRQVMGERLQVVLDLSTYSDDEAAMVMVGIVGGIWSWQRDLKSDERIPCTFFLEEADYWLPQNEQFAHVSRGKRGSDGVSNFSQLQGAFFGIVSRGRSFGLGLVASTPRPAQVDKRLIAGGDWRVLHRANMPPDLEVYKSFGAEGEIVQGLGTGEAYIFGPEITGVYQVRRRRSQEGAKTIGIENILAAPLPEYRGPIENV